MGPQGATPPAITWYCVLPSYISVLTQNCRPSFLFLISALARFSFDQMPMSTRGFFAIFRKQPIRDSISVLNYELWNNFHILSSSSSYNQGRSENEVTRVKGNILTSMDDQIFINDWLTKVYLEILYLIPPWPSNNEKHKVSRPMIRESIRLHIVFLVC